MNNQIKNHWSETDNNQAANFTSKLPKLNQQTKTKQRIQAQTHDRKIIPSKIDKNNGKKETSLGYKEYKMLS